VNWCVVRIGAAAEFNPSPPKGLVGSSAEVAFVPMASVSERGSMEVRDHRLGSELNTGFSYFQNSDVLVAKITPCYENNKIASVKIDREHGFGSTEFHVIRPDQCKLNSSYLTHFLRQDSVREAGARRMTGSAGQRRVPRGFLENLEIPLPSLDEQRRITAVLDQADGLRRKQRQALNLLSEFEDAAFSDTMKRQESAGKDWPVVELEKLSSLITDGEHQTPKRSTSGHRLLSARNVQMGRLDFNDVDFLGEEEFARIAKRCATCRDDILISCSGTIGRVSVVNYDEPMCLVRSAALVRPDKSLIDPLFLEGFLRTSRMQQIMTRAANASGQPNLFQGPIRKLQILLPPMKTQRYVADLKRAARAAMSSCESHLALLDALFASLQHRAFNGELTAKVAERELAGVG
jgi:type I restriction enzyme S subunit